MYLKPEDIESLSDGIAGRAARKMKVLVIFPPSKRAVKAMYTFHNETESGSQGAKPPLGPLYVATYLKENSDHEVKVLDCQVLSLSDEQIENEVREFAPDVVGICAWTDFWYDAWKCIQIVKNVNPGIHITVGGPHVGIYPDITLKYSGCDSVIVGDGEVPFFWLVNALSHGEKPSHLPGLHFKEHGIGSEESLFYIHGDLDSLAFPDRTLLPYKKYESVLAKGDFVTTAITSRGCPYKCTFCKLTFQKTLSRSAKDVVDEFEAIANLGIREIEVYDDTFTWSKKRLIEICKGLIERGLHERVEWAIRDRVSSPTPETMKWLAKAGCRRIHFGVESGAEKTIRRIKKGIRPEQAIEACRLAKKEGMTVLTYFMIGLPGETVEDMRETVKFAKRLGADYATFSVAVPYAGTEMYDEALREGIIPEDYWLEFAKKPEPNFVVKYFWEEHLDKIGLLAMRDEATRSFYFRPRYIWRELRKVSGMKELWRKSRMAFSLVQTSIFGKGEEVYTRNTSPGGGYADNRANPYSVRT